MASTFKLGRSFKANIQKLRTTMHKAVGQGLAKVMDQAADDARAQARWREAGNHTWSAPNGDTWEWKGTGLARQTIRAYVVGANINTRGKLKSYARSDTRNSLNGRAFPAQSHRGDPSILPVHLAQPGHYLGVLTMYPEYAKWLQIKEQQGTKSGTPGPGQYVTQAALANFGSVYAPILRRHIQAAMAAVQLR